MPCLHAPSMLCGLTWWRGCQVEGNLIKWQKWHIRIGFTWREGLVIHNVSYEDGGRLRPILFRASIAEMAVPYAESQVAPHASCSWVPAKQKILRQPGLLCLEGCAAG